MRGEAHKDVDCLSRGPIDTLKDEFIDEKILIVTPHHAAINVVTPLDIPRWKKLTEEDEQAAEHLLKARARCEGYKLTHGLLYYENKLYVPGAMRNELISEKHEDIPACHGGVRATFNRMVDYWWPNMAVDIRKYLRM